MNAAGGPYRQPSSCRPGIVPAPGPRAGPVSLPSFRGPMEVLAMRHRKRNRLQVTLLEDRSLPSACFVAQWNDLLVSVQTLRSQGNPPSARALAMMNAAIYDSVNAIDPTYTVYHVDAQDFPGVSGASADAAAAQAAHDVAYALY